MPAVEKRAVTGNVIGVEVLALLETRPVPQIVLVSQFRPPMDAYCLEMPAGLISEPQENPGDAALRELEARHKEHTSSPLTSTRKRRDIMDA